MVVVSNTQTLTDENKEPKTEKKKLLIVKKRHNSDSNRYNFGRNSIHVAFVSDEEHGRTQCTSFMTCREYLNRCALSHFVNKKFSDNYAPGTDAPIDTNKLRLLLTTDLHDMPKGAIAEFKQALFNAKAGINRYEELAGWKKSVICTVNHEVYKTNMWMITAPNEWMSQPQLLSMFVLLLRFMCLHPTIDTSSIDTIQNNIIDMMEKHEENKQKKKQNFTTDPDLECRFQNEDAVLKYAFIVKNVKEVFGGIDIEKAWPSSASDASFTTSSGIDMFIACRGGYSDTVKLLQDAFAEMWKKHRNLNVEIQKNVEVQKEVI